MVGTKILGQMGNLGSFASKLGGGGTAGGTGTGFTGTVFGKEGSTTERSNYKNKESGVDKSFVSSSGLNLGSHGAVGGIGGMGSGGLDSSLMNNILSTPSSEKSNNKSRTFSPDDDQKQ